MTYKSSRRPLTRPEVPVVSGNLPVEQNVFHPRPFADVVHDHVSAAPARPLIDDDADVRYVPSQVPGDEIARRIILRATGDG